MLETKINISAQDNASRVLASVRNDLASVGTAAARLGPILSTLGVSLSAGAAFAWLKGINDGVDALNDLKDATGASIENLSALEDIGLRTGTNFDMVGASLIKFNAALKDARPNSDQADAFKRLGLSIAELRTLDPAEALRKTAVALAGFADDGDKARLVQDMFGKSVREVAPFLKDLAEAGKLNATVSTRQAEAAEQYNKQLAIFRKNYLDIERAAVSPIVDRLNETAEAFRQATKEGKTFMEFINGRFAQGSVATYKWIGDLVGLTDPSPKAPRFLLNYGNPTANETARARLLRQGAFDKPSVGGASTGGQERARQEAIRSEANAMERYLEGLKRTLEKTQELSEVDLARARIAENLSRTSSTVTNQRIIAIATEIDRIKELNKVTKDAIEEGEALDRGLIAGEKAAQDAAGQRLLDRDKMLQQLLINTDEDRAAKIREKIDILAEAFTAGRLPGGTDQYVQAVKDALGQTGPAVEKTKSMVDDLGLSFSSAFENAIVGGQKFSDVLKGIGQDIFRLTVRKSITEPLGAYFTKSLGGLLSFDGGGYTGDGPRIGGLDGKGGFLSLVHPQETVVDHTKSRIAGGGMTQIFNFTVGDVATKSMVIEAVNVAVVRAALASRRTESYA